MPLDTTVISGTAYDANGNPKSGVKVWIKKIQQSGHIFPYRDQAVAISGTNGRFYRTDSHGKITSTIDFELVRNSNVLIQGAFFAGSTNFSNGVWKAIPDAATATLEALGDAVTLTAQAQPLDADLSQIAALNPSNDDFLQRKAGVWTNRTPAQVAADLPIGGGAWGTITGTLSDQTDLQSALDAKEDAGTAVSVMAAHLLDSDPHPQYLTASEGNAAYDAIGAASAAITTHEAASNPHPGYLTQAEGDALYAALAHTHGISDVSGLQSALDGKVDENASITGATKTKVTYDAKGLVTAGADATTADIADSSNKRYVTDAQLTVLSNTSGANSGDQTISLTGDVTGSGTGSFTATIANDAVTFAKMQNIATARILGRTTASSGDIEELDASAVSSLLGLGTLATVSPTGTPDGTKFLRDDGVWATPAGGGGGTPGGSDTQVQFNDSGSFGADAEFVVNSTAAIIDPEGTDSSPSLQKVAVSFTSTDPAPSSDFWGIGLMSQMEVDISDDDAAADGNYRQALAGFISVPDTNDKDFNSNGYLIGVSGISKFAGTGAAPQPIGGLFVATNYSPVDASFGVASINHVHADATGAIGVFGYADADPGTVVPALTAARFMIVPGEATVTDAVGVHIVAGIGLTNTTNQDGLVLEDFSGSGASGRKNNVWSKGASSINLFEGALVSGAASPPTLSNGQFTFTLDEANDQILFTVKYSDGTDKTGAVQLA